MLFDDEYKTELQRIDASNAGVQGLGYFLDTAAQWHAMFQKDPQAAQRGWERAVCKLVQAIQHHVGRRASARSILRVDQLVGMARAAMLEFEQTCR